MLARARELLDQGEWSSALSIIQALGTSLPDESPDLAAVEGLRAVAAAQAGKRKERDEALRCLTRNAPSGAEWVAIAQTHLATNDFSAADRACRQALGSKEPSPAAWSALAASYAGLGWFDECRQCLDQAGGSDRQRGLARIQLGQALNSWAMARSHAPMVALVATIILGTANLGLGLAFAATAPLVAREFRTSALDDDLRAIAEEQWQGNRSARLRYASLTLGCILGWVSSLFFLG